MMTIKLESIEVDDLLATDLRDEAQDFGNVWTGAYRVHIYLGGTTWRTVEALVIPYVDEAFVGRIGIADGAPADWGDVSHLWATPTDVEPLPEHVCDGTHGIVEAIEDWLSPDDERLEARR
jgi:hypothetical protein